METPDRSQLWNLAKIGFLLLLFLASVFVVPVLVPEYGPVILIPAFAVVFGIGWLLDPRRSWWGIPADSPVRNPQKRVGGRRLELTILAIGAIAGALLVWGLLTTWFSWS